MISATAATRMVALRYSSMTTLNCTVCASRTTIKFGKKIRVSLCCAHMTPQGKKWL